MKILVAELGGETDQINKLLSSRGWDGRPAGYGRSVCLIDSAAWTHVNMGFRSSPVYQKTKSSRLKLNTGKSFPMERLAEVMRALAWARPLLCKRALRMATSRQRTSKHNRRTSRVYFFKRRSLCKRKRPQVLRSENKIPALVFRNVIVYIGLPRITAAPCSTPPRTRHIPAPDFMSCCDPTYLYTGWWRQWQHSEKGPREKAPVADTLDL